MALPTNKLSINNSQLSIQAEGLSKRFNREWIFKNLTFTFQFGNVYAITGPNGSGKSTLLQVLWGQMPATNGTLSFHKQEETIPIENIHAYMGIATPYMDLIDEFTLAEQLSFHYKLRPIRAGFSIDQVIDRMYLQPAKNKAISNFSSGMKQRLKLGLAFFTEVPILFLDEPGTNLDQQAFDWYLENLGEIASNRLIFIASNQAEEYPQNAIPLNLTDFKNRKGLHP